jgi:hypothetical protein
MNQQCYKGILVVVGVGSSALVSTPTLTLLTPVATS